MKSIRVHKATSIIPHSANLDFRTEQFLLGMLVMIWLLLLLTFGVVTAALLLGVALWKGRMDILTAIVIALYASAIRPVVGLIREWMKSYFGGQNSQ